MNEVEKRCEEIIAPLQKQAATSLKVPIGLAATIGGAAMVNKQFNNGNLTGREKVYHNTNKKNVDSIKANGLLASKALDSNNLTHSASGDFLSDEDMAGLTYVARKRTPAIGVMLASANRDAANPESKNYRNEFKAIADRKTLVADIPIWKMQTVANPELQGANNAKELEKILKNRWHQRIDKNYGDSLSTRLVRKPGSSVSAKILKGSIYDQLGPKGTHVIKGDVSPEYIRGSEKYRKADIDEIKEYIQANPDKFKRGVLKAGVGSAISAAGVASLISGIKKVSNQEENEIEKIAKVTPEAIKKGALGAALLVGSRDLVTGKKTLYQGTSKENWDRIKSEGLKANKGGTGASKSVGNSAYQKNSQGKVHLTAMRPVANIYASANTPEISSKREEIQALKDRMLNLTVEQGEPGKSVVNYKLKRGYHKRQVDKIRAMEQQLRDMNIRQGKNPINTFVDPSILTDGKTIKVKLDYDKWKSHMEQDREGVMYKRYINKLPGNNNPIIKNMAARGSIDVPIEEISGSDASSKDKIKHTLSNLPSYIKNNPGRFAAGLGGSAIGSKLLVDSIKAVK